MDASDGVDLDSLIDLLDDDDSKNATSEANQVIYHDKADGSSDGDLDSLLGLLNKSDSPCTQNEKNGRIIQLNDNIDFSSALTQLSADSLENKPSQVHTGDTSSDEESERKEHLTETGEQIKKKIKLSSNYEDRKRQKPATWRSQSLSESISKEKPCPLDKLTGIRIVNPLVASDVMEKRLEGRKLIKMSFIRSPANKSNMEGDWVTIGVVMRKLPPKTAKNGKLFSIWKLTDLHMTDKIVTLFLFGQVHTEHWKTAVGTVIGLLNPQITDGKDQGDDYATLKVDHPGKIMLIGTSKDFGQCKSKRKDGSQCTNVVNASLCQYCAYHVKNEYKKFNQRSEIQSSFSGRGVVLRDKVLKGQNFFYGGQTFVPLGKSGTKSPSISSKDKLTLSNLTLKRKAATVFNEEKSKSADKLAELYGDDFSKAAEKNSEFINNKLTIPSAGSRNFLRHMMKNKPQEEKEVCYINPKELLKQHALKMRNPIMHKKDDSTILKNLVPVLGKGLRPGQNVSLDSKPANSTPLGEYAKIRAIQKIRNNGPIKKKDPNGIKSNPEPEKIKAALESSFEEKSANTEKGDGEIVLSRSKLGSINLNSEKIKNILSRRSSHAYEVEMAEMEREAAYFDRLEKKEMMEEKMSSTKELVCDVVSCRQCRYTAHQAADRCKNENHPLKCHKAIKRFFSCKDCKLRTECFSRFPLQSCRHCGSSCFERTGMIKVRSGPKLDSETLNIRGDEIRFLNSLW